MYINLLFSHVTADDLFFTGKTTVVIDVLRASTTIVKAIENGAREVIPVASVEFAVKVSGGMFGGQTLLGGERNTKKIEGFALGNSPLEYKREIVEGKSIIFYTTNGSKAIVKAKFSENLFICSFNNLSAVARHLVKLNSDFIILCAGNNNHFSYEDSVCAGRLISEISALNNTVKIADAAKAAQALAKSTDNDNLTMLKLTEHGQLLLKNGFEKDLEVCSKLNVTETVPFFKSNVLKALVH